ncbi:MAG: MBL fold metallo-hydrolase [Saprospiraceae bacterium]|nr:MBL fold metallo-hydrolase [Saprospiraceae bacterium]
MKIQLEKEGLVIFESVLYRTTTTLVIHQDYLLLVDPNWLPSELSFISDYINKLNGVFPNKYLLFTHSDYDHIIGYGKFRDFQSIASHAFVSNPYQSKILNQIREFDNQYYVSRDYRISYPDIDHAIEGDRQLNSGSETFHFFQAPGHAMDAIITYVESAGILIVGDYLSNIEFPFIDHNFQAYYRTLEKLDSLLSTLDVKILITGHGDYTQRKEEMLGRLLFAREYLDDLKDSVIYGNPYDLNKLASQFDFFEGMKEAHRANFQLTQRELKAV